MSSPSKRREMDVMKLMMSDYEVETINDGLNEFNVFFHGPKDSLYEGGVWKIHVELQDAYPYKSPSIGFLNRIYHPNVDEVSGSVCLDVINQTWSPMFDLLNVFEVFLPQLLLYPNASDPLNGDAASLMMKDRQQYDEKVKGKCFTLRDAMKIILPEYFGDKSIKNEKALDTESEETQPTEASSEITNAEEVNSAIDRCKESDHPSQTFETKLLRIQGIERKLEIPFSWVVNNLNLDQFLHICVYAKCSS